MSRQNPESEDSFASYCELNGIRPIKQDKVVLLPIAGVKPRKMVVAADAYEPAMFHYDDSLAEYYVDGQKNVSRDLRRGKYKIIACIDLHNHTQGLALNKLENFIEHSTTRGDTCLKIIHGKGLNSKSANGVLKHLVRRYLERHTRLLAYSSAETNQGGDGVTLLKLKNQDG